MAIPQFTNGDQFAAIHSRDISVVRQDAAMPHIQNKQSVPQRELLIALRNDRRLTSRMDLSQFSAKKFDRGASFLKEALWVLIKCVLFLPPWPMPSAARVLALRGFGATVGCGVVIRSKVNITFPWRLILGNHVWLGEEVFILNLAPVAIESNVCVSQRAFICTGSHDFRREDFALIAKPIVIREGAWVAAQAFVGPGVELGKGAILSAGSVAMNNIPDGCLAAGNPAKVVKENIRASSMPD